MVLDSRHASTARDAQFYDRDEIEKTPPDRDIGVSRAGGLPPPAPRRTGREPLGSSGSHLELFLDAIKHIFRLALGRLLLQ